MSFRWLVLVISFLLPHIVQAQAVLENPTDNSFQSGIATLSGWAYDAVTVQIEIDGQFVLDTAYGTTREDTLNNGLRLILNGIGSLCTIAQDRRNREWSDC